MLQAEAEHVLAAGQFEGALAVAERLRAEVAQCGEEDFAGLAEFYLGAIHHHMGHPQESEGYLDQASALLTRVRRAEIRAAIGADLFASSLAYSALNQWFLGYPQTALALSRQAMASARAEGAVVGLACSTAFGANLLAFLRVDEAGMAELTEECHRLCLQHGIRMWRVFAEVLLGRVMVMRGQDAAGIERIQGGIAAWRAMGMALGVDLFAVCLADTCLLAASRRASPSRLTNGNYRGAEVIDPTAADKQRGGLLATGLVVIDAIFGPGRAACGLCYEAELHRLRGELLLARDGLAVAGEAVDCFRRAVQFGSETGARACELRAAMSLVRLRECQVQARAADQGVLEEARSCLRNVYARYPEGFALPDLEDAAALIGGPGTGDVACRPDGAAV